MKQAPNYEDFLKKWAELYQNVNYDSGLTGFFLRKSHEWAEAEYGDEAHFAKVLEVGAGTGEHIKHVKHKYDEYWITDLNLPMMTGINDNSDERKNKNIFFSKQDATKLTFEDHSFDRVIAAHVLEHLVNPTEALKEWVRVLKPNGVLSLVLPCDPGVAWRLGRYLVARKKAIAAGIEYDYWMAREHVNPINNLVSFVRYHFPNAQEKWLPLKIASIDLNLFYVVNLKIQS
jgi:ubiquinone/menaquinone biosynthesis C-methylase UbiE